MQTEPPLFILAFRCWLIETYLFFESFQQTPFSEDDGTSNYNQNAKRKSRNGPVPTQDNRPNHQRRAILHDTCLYRKEVLLALRSTLIYSRLQCRYVWNCNCVLSIPLNPERVQNKKRAERSIAPPLYREKLYWANRPKFPVRKQLVYNRPVSGSRKVGRATQRGGTSDVSKFIMTGLVT